MSLFMPKSAYTSIFSTSISIKSTFKSAGKTSSTKSTLTTSSIMFLYESTLGALARKISAPPVFSGQTSIFAEVWMSEAPTWYILVIYSRSFRQIFFLRILQETLYGSNTYSFPCGLIRFPMTIAYKPVWDPRLRTIEFGLRKYAARRTMKGYQTPCSLILLETAPSIGSMIISKPYLVDTISYLSDRGNLFDAFQEVETYSQGICREKVVASRRNMTAIIQLQQI